MQRASASYYLFDGLGSTIQLAAQSGTISDSYLTDSFGNTIAATGNSINPFRYIGLTGYYYDDDTGAYYVRTRYYTPSSGRFISLDRVSNVNAELASFIYAANSPLNYTDPSGLKPGVSVAAAPAPKQLPPFLTNLCGGGAAFVNWTLDPELVAAKANGYIVQHVNFSVQAFECSKRGENLPRCEGSYWELWRVQGGKILPPKPHDSFAVRDFLGTTEEGACRKSTAYMRGFTRFVADADVHPQSLLTEVTKTRTRWRTGPLSFLTDSCRFYGFTTGSGTLLRTTDKDLVMSRLPLDKGKTGLWDSSWDSNRAEVVAHDMRTNANCCPTGCPPCPL